MMKRFHGADRLCSNSNALMVASLYYIVYILDKYI